MTLQRDASSPELVQAINALTTAVQSLDTKLDDAITDRQMALRLMDRQITRLETEMRFIQYFGGAAGLAVIGLIIERIAGAI